MNETDQGFITLCESGPSEQNNYAGGEGTETVNTGEEGHILMPRSGKATLGGDI